MDIIVKHDFNEILEITIQAKSAKFKFQTLAKRPVIVRLDRESFEKELRSVFDVRRSPEAASYLRKLNRDTHAADATLRVFQIDEEHKVGLLTLCYYDKRFENIIIKESNILTYTSALTKACMSVITYSW